MKKIDTYELAKLVQKVEIEDLINAVKSYGGRVTFADEEEAGADVSERACVMVNAKNIGPVDVYINSVELDEKEKLHIVGEYKEDFEEYDINVEEIAVGHIGFITEMIPLKPAMKRLWIQIGVEITATDEEIETILRDKGSWGRFDLHEIIHDGRFRFTGPSCVPAKSIEDFNSEYDTEFEAKTVEYDF
jgi:hypothetical protein